MGLADGLTVLCVHLLPCSEAEECSTVLPEAGWGRPGRAGSGPDNIAQVGPWGAVLSAGWGRLAFLFQSHF